MIDPGSLLFGTCMVAVHIGLKIGSSQSDMKHLAMMATESQQQNEQLVAENRELRETIETERLLLLLGKDSEITMEDIQEAQRAIGYIPNRTNIAVVGGHNAGKSSLVNRFRGLGHDSRRSAEVGEVETTSVVTQYLDENNTRIAWYDLPGSNTASRNIKPWKFYHDLKLYAYDKIVLVHKDALSPLDVKIMVLCKNQEQECILVRSQTDNHIRNNSRRKECPIPSARQNYINQVRMEREVLRAQCVDLINHYPDYFDHIICEQGLAQVMKEGLFGSEKSMFSEDQPEFPIDELALIKKLGLVL